MGVYQQGTPIEISDTFTVDGIETNPTTVTYTILGPDGVTTAYVFGVDPEVTNPSVGNFLLSLAPPSLPGEYQYDVDATGAVVASRAASFTVLPNVATGVTDMDWAVVGPCAPWADAQDVWDCCGQPMTTIGEGSSAIECPVDMTQFAFEASQLLYELSGRLFSGACEKTVVACEGDCGCNYQVLSRGHVIGPWDWDFGWGWYSGQWCWPCGCPSTIKLSGYPVREIVEVVIDGVALAAGDYRLDERRYLRRLDGGHWPFCDRLCRLGTEDENTVTYRYGQDPPTLGVHAAAQLGCELYKACSGQECALPAGVSRYTRQGVTVEKQAFTAWAYQPGRGSITRGWRTGLNLVDAFLAGYNPGAIKRRPVFWAPGRRYARSIGQ